MFKFYNLLFFFSIYNNMTHFIYKKVIVIIILIKFLKPSYKIIHFFKFVIKIIS